MIPFSFQQVVFGTIAAINLFAAVYVLLKNRRSTVNRSFFIFALGIALWGAGMLLLSFTENPLFIDPILYGGHTIVLGVVLLARFFPNEEGVKKAFWLYLAPLLALFPLTPFHLFIRSAIVHKDGSLEPANGPLIVPMALIIGAYVFLSARLFVKRYRRLSGLGRLQMKYLFMGIAIFTGAMFFFDVLLPALNIFSLNAMGPLASAAFIGLTGYAIIRHELMDIRVVIQRGAIYSVLFVIVVGFYLAAVSMLGFIFHEKTNTTILLSAGLTVLAGIFGIQPLERLFRSATDRIFFKDTYDYSKAMHELSEALNRHLDLEKLTSHLIGILKSIFRVEKVFVFLIPENILFDGSGNPQTVAKVYSDELVIELGRHPGVIVHSEIPHKHKDDMANESWRTVLAEVSELGKRGSIDVTVPIILEEKMLGTLVMGKKRSGDAYTAEDLGLLRTLSYQLAVALERAELYQQVQERSRELEEKVGERTAQLKKLQEEQKQMMVDISHALQTPLTVVKGELGILKKHMIEQEKITAVERSIDEVSRLTYDFLRLARMESGQKTLKKERVDFSRLLEHLVEYFTTLSEDRGIAVTSAIEPDITILGDKDKLEDMVTNLLSNAVKYMPEKGEKKISIKLQKRLSQGVFTVQDSGVGIAKEELPYVFDRFYRAKNATELDARGAGLGLAICRKILEEHHGTIDVESELDKGTLFIAALPLL